MCQFLQLEQVRKEMSIHSMKWVVFKCTTMTDSTVQKPSATAQELTGVRTKDEDKTD